LESFVARALPPMLVTSANVSAFFFMLELYHDTVAQLTAPFSI